MGPRANYLPVVVDQRILTDLNQGNHSKKLGRRVVVVAALGTRLADILSVAAVH